MINYYSLGSKGEEVKKIQRLLTNLGYSLNIDGVYGEKTKNVVTRYQTDNNLLIDGVVGPKTYEKLLLKNGYNEAEAYINSRDFFSKTKYFIYVNLSKFTVSIFSGRNKEWQLIKQYPATIGKKQTPTVTGSFTVKAKGEGYAKPKEGFKVKWYTQFYRGYLFHSILFNFDGTIFDGRLKMALSDGCIRLNELDAKYIYDFVPYGSLVVIENT